MPVIEEFPPDDAYWLVKWVDKFTLPHLTTRSCSVTVRLQRLPLLNHAELSDLGRRDAAALLPLDKSDPQRNYTSVSLHAGLLPHLNVGRLYRGKRPVGELPTSRTMIVLPDAEQSCREVRIGDELERPANWTYPYRLIHSAEFGGIQSEFSRSRCLVFNEGGIEYIIPRTVIFQRFYAIQRELANAFTSGPWATTKRKVVFEGALESGLKTQIDPATGEWHVILQTHVEDDFVCLAALLYFDKYARACAESIYTGMLSDLHGKQHAPWFASAKIPFRAEAKPLRLDVKGFKLLPRVGMSSDGKREVCKRAFLVTSILGSSWPSYAPQIRWNRFNSGDKGREQIPAEGDKPYAGHPRGRPAGSDLVVTSRIDASAVEGDAIMLEDTFSWLDGANPEKLTKDSSKLYSGNVASSAPSRPPTTASGGERNYQKGNVAPAHYKVLVRDPVNRFRYLLDAFDALQRTVDIGRHGVVQPIAPSQIANCNGLVCWNFLDKEARETGLWPSAGWRMLERARRSGAERRPGKPRCVLVVRVEIGTGMGYWFEIETRKSEGGALSPFIVATEVDEQEAVQHIVESIARAEGRSLRQAMNNAIRELGSGSAHCYKHHYIGDRNAALDPDSLRRFLAKISAAGQPRV